MQDDGFIASVLVGCFELCALCFNLCDARG
jgi:hypothetical protein